MVEPGVHEALQVLGVDGGIRPARDVLGHILLTDRLRRLLEVDRSRELLAEIAGDGDVRPDLAGEQAPLFLRLGPAGMELCVARLPGAASLTERGYELLVWGDADQRVARRRGDPGRVLLPCGHG